MNIDIDYVLRSFSSLMGVPVRHYEDKTEVFFYSLIKFHYDPFLLDEEKVLDQKEEIGYYLDEDDFYYCYLNHGKTTIVIGPTRNTPAEEQCLKLLALRLEIPLDRIGEFMKNMSLLSTIPFKCVLESLTMLYYIMTGEKKNLVSLFFDESKETNEKVPQITEKSIVHSSYPIEQDILHIVKSGNVQALESFISSVPNFNAGILSPDALRQEKNSFIATITLISRAAIEEGVQVNEALSLSDYYIRKCESCSKAKDISTIYYEMTKTYTERVRMRKSMSPLQYQVLSYIQKHLDRMISLEEIAEACSFSKSSLCLRFKEETGKTVSNYIHEVKIGKAKELIEVGLSFSAISYYLGYSSQSHFTKTFEKISGITPSDYKRACKFN